MEEKQYKYHWQKREENRNKEPKQVDRRTGNNLAKEEAIYSVLRKDYLIENPLCQCGRPNCTRIATEIHHKKGRGIWLNVVDFFLGVCSTCHKWIEANPAEAKRLGYSVDRVEKKHK